MPLEPEHSEHSDGWLAEQLMRIRLGEKSPEELPQGVLARIDVYETGLKVNLLHSMSTKDFAQLLHGIADAYEHVDQTRCSQCDGLLEPAQSGGFVHADDSDDADGHAPVVKLDPPL